MQRYRDLTKRARALFRQRWARRTADHFAGTRSYRVDPASSCLSHNYNVKTHRTTRTLRWEPARKSSKRPRCAAAILAPVRCRDVRSNASGLCQRLWQSTSRKRSRMLAFLI